MATSTTALVMAGDRCTGVSKHANTASSITINVITVTSRGRSMA